jgi:hypothetical protein
VGLLDRGIKSSHKFEQRIDRLLARLERRQLQQAERPSIAPSLVKRPCVSMPPR